MKESGYIINARYVTVISVAVLGAGVAALLLRAINSWLDYIQHIAVQPLRPEIMVVSL